MFLSLTVRIAVKSSYLRVRKLPICAVVGHEIPHVANHVVAGAGSGRGVAVRVVGTELLS